LRVRHDSFQYLPNVDLLDMGGVHPCLQPGKLEKLADQLVQAFYFEIDAVKFFFRIAAGPLPRKFQRNLQSRER
jgi:hypothetical protein